MVGTKPLDHATLALLESRARTAAKFADSILNPKRDEDKFGFCLFFFSFEGSEMTWTSNTERTGMLAALKEFITRLETEHHTSTHERMIARRQYRANEIGIGDKDE